jgi:hypothetical protein
MTGQPSRIRGQFFRNGHSSTNGSSPIDLVIDRLTRHGCEPRAAGAGQWKSRCPAHQGKSSNLSIKENADGSVLLHCHHASNGSETCSAAAIVEALDLELKDIFATGSDPVPKKPTGSAARSKRGNRKLWRSPEEAIGFIAKKDGARVSKLGPWVYKARDGHELMRVYRLDKEDGSKAFRPLHVDASGWYIGDPPGVLPLYHLDELDAADVVYVTEGEKCADLVRDLGLTATTSSHGAGGAAKSDWAPLAGKTVVVIPDNDSPGEKYLDNVGKILSELDPAPIIRVVRLPLKSDGDVEQWIHDVVPETWQEDQCRAELERLAAAASTWEPTASMILASDDALGEDVIDPIGNVDPVAFHGPLGQLALATQPETEANALFVLLHLMAFFGAAAGRGPHFIISASVHYLNLFVGLIGASGFGRKGTAAHVAKEIWRKIDPTFTADNITDGLNSGAGLLYNLRDASEKSGKNGTADEGVMDKRRVFLESELSSVQMQGHRENDPLLGHLRKFFDGEEIIRSNTKDPTKVTGGHVTAVGHCTPADLEIHLSEADKANGTANRFLWAFGVRSKLLPRGGDVFDLLDNFLGSDLQKLKDAVEFAKGVGKIRRDSQVEARWENLYREFNEIPPGRIGAFFVRAPTIVLRLASIFALADRKNVIEGSHLDAALAIWEHSARSLRWIFRSDVDPRAEKLLAALKAASEGLTKRQIIHDVFKRNADAAMVDDLLLRLLAHQAIVAVKDVSRGGRPGIRYLLKQW